MGGRPLIDWKSKSPRLEALLKQGLTHRSIAASLGISVGAVQRQIAVLNLPPAQRAERIKQQRLAVPKHAKACTFEPIRGRRPVLQNIPTEDLQIDPAYQRQIDSGSSQSLIRRIAARWDWALCQPLVVSDRGGEGELFVIDGQHRLEAARLRGDIADLPCVIVRYPDAAAEAANFVALNQARRALTPIEIFRAALAAGDPEAIEIGRAVECAGLQIAAHTNNMNYKPGQIGNVGGLKNALRKHGYQILRESLEVLAKAFAGQRLAYAGTIFPGIVAAIADCPDEASDLARELCAKGQQAVYSAVMKARAADPNLDMARASALVIRRFLRRGAPQLRTELAAPVNLSKFSDGRAWCDQCELRVTEGQAGSCRSPFCKLKVQAGPKPARIAG